MSIDVPILGIMKKTCLCLVRDHWFSKFSGSLVYTSHNNKTFQNVGTAIGTVMCQVPDWSGGRQKRQSLETASRSKPSQSSCITSNSYPTIKDN